MPRLSDFYTLTKPGIIYGNAVTVIGGYFLAARGHFAFTPFLGVIIGSSLIMACACVINNYMDRDIDVLMKRTQNRPSVTGSISLKIGSIFAAVLGMIGILILLLTTNLLTTGIGIFGLFAYVALYGIAKRRSPMGTIIGSISGAIPPVAGYTSLTNHIDAGALLLFVILVAWQMPHFYAIAMYRFEDYKTAKIPVLPVKKGMRATQLQIMGYIVAFCAAISALTALHYTGYVFLVIMLGIGIAWLLRGIQGFSTEAADIWGRKMFRFSLIVITAFSIMVSVGPIVR